MRKQIAAAALVVGAGMLAAAPAAAQQAHVGVFPQTLQNNPFSAMLYGRPAVSGFTTAELGNNTLNLGDVFALAELRSDLRPTDLFLVGGLVPEGEGARFGGRGDAALALGGIATRFGTFGIQMGAHALSQGHVPDDVARLAREGNSGDEPLAVDFTNFGGKAITYSDVGVMGLFHVPVPPRLNPHLPPVRMQAGVGLRYLHGFGYSSFTFTGADGTGRALATSSHEGIDTDLRFSRSTDFATRGGSGFAADLFLTAAVGQSVIVNALVGDLGFINGRGGDMEVRQLATEDATIRQFLNALQDVEADTVAAGDETIRLPARVRLEGSYAVSPRFMAGAALDFRTGRDFAVNPRVLTGQAQYLAAPWLPIRAGVSLGGDHGIVSGELGLGLRLDRVRFDAALGGTGGPLVSDYRGGAFRTGLVVLF